MRIDWDTTAVVGDTEVTVGLQFYFDEVRMSCNSFVHRIVDDFSEQVMHRSGIGAANIHAWPHAYRFDALENLDVCSTIGTFTTVRRWLGRFAILALCFLFLARRSIARRWGGFRVTHSGKEVVVVIHQAGRASIVFACGAGAPGRHSQVIRIGASLPESAESCEP